MKSGVEYTTTKTVIDNWILLMHHLFSWLVNKREGSLVVSSSGMMRMLNAWRDALVRIFKCDCHICSGIRKNPGPGVPHLPPSYPSHCKTTLVDGLPQSLGLASNKCTNVLLFTLDFLHDILT